MSKGNIIQGQASGKLGDTVLMVRNGQQLARVYTKAGARSGKDASEAARIQRVKFGSASNQWSLYRFVSTRMYRRGRKSSQSDYNYFVKKNANLLPYFTKAENLDGVHVLQPGTFSEGSFGRIELLHFFNAAPQPEQSLIKVSDVLVNNVGQIAWTATMASLKTFLRELYPYARKITYLFSLADEITIEEAEETFVGQQVSHSYVTIDLYAETSTGENAMTISAYFKENVGNPLLAGVFDTQTAQFALGKEIFRILNYTSAPVDALSRLGVLIFATDDNASDCYTTVLPVDGVNPTVGVYSLWASYRTAESLRIAADSYGYQSGVMRDDIASFGNDIGDMVANYSARLAIVSKEDATTFLKSVEKAGGAKAVNVRKTVDAVKSSE